MRSVKCVIVGDGAVGKTSLLISYTTNTFPQDYIPTVFDNYTTTIALNNGEGAEPQIFRLNLWDTAGQEEYDRLRPLSYPQTDVFLLCFGVNEPNSFANVMDKWLPEIRHNTNFENIEQYQSHGKFPILLVGTKSDLREDEHEQDRLRELNADFVSRAQIDQCVSRYGFMGYVECSAATQVGVANVFERAVEIVVAEPQKDAATAQREATSGVPVTQRGSGGGTHAATSSSNGPKWHGSTNQTPSRKKKKRSKCSIL